MLRECLDREIVAVETPLGVIRFKVARRDGQVLNAAPEFDDCARIAAAQRAARQGRPGAGADGLDEPYQVTMPRFYITTPIYYINAEPHLGHAYTTMVADAIARSRRLVGDDVFFLTGTDEHGQKWSSARAKKAGIDTHEFCDRMAREIPGVWRPAGNLERRFHPDDRAAPQSGGAGNLAAHAAAGDIYKASYEGWYCDRARLFVPEEQLVDGPLPDMRHRGRSGSARRAISSSSRSSSSRCSITTARSPSSSPRRSAATR